MRSILQSLKIIAGIFGFLLYAQQVSAQRTFIHPGLTYTQSDLDRMKAMVEARQEPFYTTYIAMVESSYSIPGDGNYANITQIEEGRFNTTVGGDGRKAHDMALLYHITGNRRYADDAVARLNRYNNLTNASCRGTAPLDNGKVFLLIEAAELLRDYDGWQPADQQAFKQMLTYPFYSTTQSAESYKSLNDADNGVSFYWNIYNFDPGRFGNQGLFAARSLMAMGVFLDNDTIYDRAYRYLMNLPHRSDDLPYASGPPVQNSVKSESDYMIDYNVSWGNSIDDYHSDEILQYYIYANGQCQESCRDQAHTMAGVGNYTAVSEIAWNQGDSLYNCLNNRILKGIEYNTRYNLSKDHSYSDQPTPWEPTGFSKVESDCTYDNGIFYQAVSRSKRWEAKNISPDGRGEFGTGGWRAQSLAHYSTRMGMPAEDLKWLQRSYDVLMADYGYENWGTAPNWYYEWTGWGTLTKNRADWMAGDAGTFVNGERVSGMPEAPCSIKAVDYDYFPEDGEGRTYHNEGHELSTIYRTDGTVEIINDGGEDVVSDMVVGEWLSYSLRFPAGAANTEVAPVRQYNVYATYKSQGSGARLFAAIGNGEKKGKELAQTDVWTEHLLGTFDVTCGAATMRIYVKGQSNLLTLKSIRVEPIEEYVLQKVDLADISIIKVYDENDVDVTSSYTSVIDKATDGVKGTAINMSTKKFMVFDFDENGLDINKIILYNNGVTQYTNEFAAVCGATKDGPFTSSWVEGTKLDFLRTNGTHPSGLTVPVINNSWVTTGGVEGSYTVGPVGKYRYLAVYNWSANFNASEIEIYSVVNTQINNPNTEASAVWDETDETGNGLPTNATNADINPKVKVFISGNEVYVSSAKSMDVYTFMGVKYRSTKSNRIVLPKGGYILRIETGKGIVTRKVIVTNNL